MSILAKEAFKRTEENIKKSDLDIELEETIKTIDNSIESSIKDKKFECIYNIFAETKNTADILKLLEKHYKDLKYVVVLEHQGVFNRFKLFWHKEIEMINAEEASKKSEEYDNNIRDNFDSLAEIEFNKALGYIERNISFDRKYCLYSIESYNKDLRNKVSLRLKVYFEDLKYIVSVDEWVNSSLIRISWNHLVKKHTVLKTEVEKESKSPEELKLEPMPPLKQIKRGLGLFDMTCFLLWNKKK